MGHLRKQLIIVCATALKVMSDSTNLGYPAILLPLLRLPDSGFHTDKHIDSWIASSSGLGMICGIALIPITIDRFGRKACHLASGLPMAVGWLLIIFADSPVHFIAARFIQGVTIGYRAPITSMVIAESTDPRHRGAFLGTTSASVALGIFIPHLIGTFLQWMETAIACLMLGIISTTILIFLPDSPTWLAKVGRYDDARRAFAYYRGNGDEAKQEIELIILQQKDLQKNLEVNSNGIHQKISSYLAVILKREFYKPLLILLAVFTAYIFSGTYVLSSFSVDIITKIAGSNLSPYVIMLSLDLVRFCVSIFGLGLIKRFKRRVVYFTSFFITVSSLLSLSLYIYLDKKYSLNIISFPLISLLGYILGLGLGLQSFPHVLLGELFSVEHKGLGSAIASLYLYLSYFASIISGPYMFADLGEIGTFLVYSFIISCCCVILYFIMPETKDKTLQEIQSKFTKKVKVVHGYEYELKQVET